MELGATRRRDVERYVVLVAQELLLVEQILALAEELKSGTIERMLAKSDLELGLEALDVKTDRTLRSARPLTGGGGSSRSAHHRGAHGMRKV